MFRKTLCAVCSVVIVLSLVGCSSTETKQPPELTGQWKQANSNSDDAYQTATVQDGTIEIYWVVESDDTKALYWAGSFDAPKTADEPYAWDSKNDTEKTGSSIMASPDETKTFTYSDGQISYDVSMMGVTQTVKLEKTQ